MINFLESKSVNLVIPALSTIGNIATGTNKQTDMLLFNGVLPKLEKLLSHDKNSIRRKTCWVLSNIAAGN